MIEPPQAGARQGFGRDIRTETTAGYGIGRQTDTIDSNRLTLWGSLRSNPASRSKASPPPIALFPRSLPFPAIIPVNIETHSAYSGSLFQLSGLLQIPFGSGYDA